MVGPGCLADWRAHRRGRLLFMNIPAARFRDRSVRFREAVEVYRRPHHRWQLDTAAIHHEGIDTANSNRPSASTASTASAT